MRKYSSYSRKRKSNKGKLVVVLLVLGFAAFKIYNSSMNPATTFAGDKSFETQIIDQQPDISLPLPVSTPGPEETKTGASNTHQAEFGETQDRSVVSEDVSTPVDSKLCSKVQARESLNQMLCESGDQRQISLIKKQLSSLSEKWLFSGEVLPEDKLCENYKVKSGDTATHIGSKFNVPYQILLKINNISDPRSLRAGETIKVINGPFHCRVNRSSFTMDLYLQDTYVRSFVVGLGKPGMETPSGKWIVKKAGKLISPAWTDPDTGKTYDAKDADYPLGSRWIGLEGIEGNAKGRSGFAIHGTNAPEQLGKAQSRGCIRLFDDHVKFVYDLLTEGKSQVIVEE